MTVSTSITFADGEQLHFTPSFDLPMQDETVTRLNGGQANLRTYLGNDPLGMSYDEFQVNILDTLSRSVPLILEEPAFGSTHAVVDDSKLNKKLFERLHEPRGCFRKQAPPK